MGGILVGAIVCSISFKSCNQSRQDVQQLGAPLLDNLGNYKLDITTKSELASKFFTQGIIMANGFNHGEAERSFREAVKQDSTCAMAHWGIAYVLGPNYNSDRVEGNQEIYDAIINARKYAGNAQSWEKALIEVMQIKFPAEGSTVDEEAFSNAMRAVADR